MENEDVNCERSQKDDQTGNIVFFFGLANQCVQMKEKKTNFVKLKQLQLLLR